MHARSDTCAPLKTKLQVCAAREDLELHAPVSSTHCHSQNVPDDRRGCSTVSPTVLKENAADSGGDLSVKLSGLILNMLG